MHCVVIGAGIVGTVTAFALIRAGHSVDVFESADGVAQGASYANAGMVSPGHCFSWAEPGMLPMMVRSLLGIGDGIGVAHPFSPKLWRWGIAFLRQTGHQRWTASSEAALRMSAYSRDMLFEEFDIPLSAYGGARKGILYLYGPHGPKEAEFALLRKVGEPYEVLGAGSLAKREPLLAVNPLGFDQGVFCPNDATGNAAQFAAAVTSLARRHGARFHLSESVTRLLAQGDRVIAVKTSKQRVAPDAVVVTSGLASAALLAPLGYRLPIYPVTGYSSTYSVVDGQRPAVGAVSVPHKIAWASFGTQIVRFTGFADMGVPGPSTTQARFAALERFAAQVCPSVSPLTPARWVGQRPMTPDGLPFLGHSRHANLLLNCGHGAMGWTMACGSARLITDLMAGRAPAIDPQPYRWNR